MVEYGDKANNIKTIKRKQKEERQQHKKKTTSNNDKTTKKQITYKKTEISQSKLYIWKY